MPDLIDVHHVAKLASLTLSDAEAARFEGELRKIVAFVAQLDELDTTGVPSVDGDGFAVPTFVESAQ